MKEKKDLHKFKQDVKDVYTEYLLSKDGSKERDSLIEVLVVIYEKKFKYESKENILIGFEIIDDVLVDIGTENVNEFRREFANCFSNTKMFEIDGVRELLISGITGFSKISNQVGEIEKEGSSD